MSVTANWAEDNGTATGSPAHGTTRSGFGADTHYPTDINWKNEDSNTANSGQAYSAVPIVAGQNSYSKYQYVHFTGTFNQILNGIWSAHTAGTSPMGTGLTLVGKVTSTYATPATSTLSSTTDFSSTVVIGSGISVSFSTTGPEDASPTSTLSSAGYSQYMATQLQTTSGATSGDTASITATFRYDAN